MRAIFISYRREDSPGEAGRLFDDLVRHFGEQSVFMDVANIQAGRDFRKAIDESVSGCGVLLAVIGPGWLETRNERGGRRLDDPSDFVRNEIASALRRDIPVVPVLVRGATLPPPERVPQDMTDVVYRNGVELTHVHWKSDVQILVDALRPIVSEPLATTEVERSGCSAGLTAAAADPALEPAAVRKVARELADHIGPIAGIIVKRASMHCATIADLRRVVAEEIEGTDNRRAFLQRDDR
jgi:hypothetical protein